MRTAFIENFMTLAADNPRLFLITGDLGFSVLEPFAETYPDRFLNAGVAEQNMTGLAAGLASEGYHVFTYSIANFPTLRCLEQIRNDVCYHKLPVTVVAVGAGMAYGNLGYSHHGLQDIAALRSLPGMEIWSPADPGETANALRWVTDNPGPSYLRLGKAGEPPLHTADWQEEQLLTIRQGERNGIALVATGSQLKEVLQAAESLQAEGIAVSVFSAPRLVPPNPGQYLAPLADYKEIHSYEEHSPVGGLGSLLAETFSGTVKVVRHGVGAEYISEVGSQDYLRKKAGLDSASIVASIKKRHE